MDYYPDFVPTELKEIIFSYVSDANDLNNLGDMLMGKINWGTVNQYHFGYYNNLSYWEYLIRLRVSKIIKEWNLKYTPDALLNIKYLHVSNKGLVDIPKEIGELTNLKGLYLSNNQIGTIPNSITRLINLQDLYLDNNKIEEIPSSIGVMRNLKHINLKRNSIRHIPTEILKLPNLQLLFIGHNPIENKGAYSKDSRIRLTLLE